MDDVHGDAAEILPSGEWRPWEEENVDVKEVPMLDGDDEVVALVPLKKKGRQGKKRKFPAVTNKESEANNGIFKIFSM